MRSGHRKKVGFLTMPVKKRETAGGWGGSSKDWSRGKRTRQPTGRGTAALHAGAQKKGQIIRNRIGFNGPCLDHRLRAQTGKVNLPVARLNKGERGLMLRGDF